MFPLGQAIVNFKLQQLFTNGIVFTDFTDNGVTVSITPAEALTLDQIRNAILDEFDISINNAVASKDGLSFRFGMILDNIKLKEPQDIVEYNESGQ